MENELKASHFYFFQVGTALQVAGFINGISAFLSRRPENKVLRRNIWNMPWVRDFLLILLYI